MRTIQIVVSGVYILLLSTPFVAPVYAQADCAFGEFEAALPGLEGKTVCDFVNQDRTSPLLRYAAIVINVITAMIVIIALIMIIIGGYMYMTAGGSSERVGLAKSFIGSALLGVAIALTAYILLNTIGPQFASGLREPSL